MLKSQTDIHRNRFGCITMVVILIIGSLLILGFQIVLVIGSFHEFRWLFIIFVIVRFFVGTNMTIDVMQSATFELNTSDSLHSAQTNTAIANEARRTLIFANGNSVGGSVGLELERPEMHPVGSFILTRQHSVTAQFH